MEEQNKEINEMIEDFVPPASAPAPAPANVEVPAVETKPAEEVSVHEQEGEKRSEEAASGQEQIGEPAKQEEGVKEEVKPAAPVVPEPVKREPESELDRAKRELAETRQRLEEMAGRMFEPPKRPPLTPEQQTALKAEAEKRAKQAVKFVPTDEAFDDVMRSSDNFNAFMTNVTNYVVERVLRMVPQVATQYVDQQLTFKTAAQDFYRANEDLVPHQKYVGFVSNELLAQHADWDLPKLLEETEKEVRARLKLPKSSQAGGQISGGNTRTVTQNPGFVPGGGGSRRGSVSDRPTGMEKDILDLIS